MSTHLWIRAESRPTEERAPLVTEDVGLLVAEGFTVSVERSERRCFADEEYAAAGAELVDTGGWVDAPEDAYVIGIKELPEEPADLRHAHIYFAHAFKGQTGAGELLARFERGHGELLDVEYLTRGGRRVVAFGRWAGYVGAALGVLALRGRLSAPLTPMHKDELDAALADAPSGAPLRALVVGAAGRSGGGAVEALEQAGADLTRWDRRETEQLDRAALLAHDLLVNCVVSRGPSEAFVRPADVAAERRLAMIADVTCDVTSPANLLPVNTAITTWDDPVRHLSHDPALDVIAIDNLPSLLPREASVSFSAELTPQFSDLADRAGAWAEAAAAYQHARTGD